MNIKTTFMLVLMISVNLIFSTVVFANENSEVKDGALVEDITIEVDGESQYRAEFTIQPEEADSSKVLEVQLINVFLRDENNKPLSGYSIAVQQAYEKEVPNTENAVTGEDGRMMIFADALVGNTKEKVIYIENMETRVLFTVNISYTKDTQALYITIPTTKEEAYVNAKVDFVKKGTIDTYMYPTDGLRVIVIGNNKLPYTSTTVDVYKDESDTITKTLGRTNLGGLALWRNIDHSNYDIEIYSAKGNYKINLNDVYIGEDVAEIIITINEGKLKDNVMYAFEVIINNSIEKIK